MKSMEKKTLKFAKFTKILDCGKTKSIKPLFAHAFCGLRRLISSFSGLNGSMNGLRRYPLTLKVSLPLEFNNSTTPLTYTW